VTARVLSAYDEERALEDLHATGRTDGLPVVIPTRERVDRVLDGRDRDELLGDVGPANRPATVEAVAINAVMAGCLPEHLPIVIAAVRAVLDPVFDLTEVQSTTHNVAPLIIVNGPARGRAGVASGVGALGPGYRANAAIGRALRLVLMNVGGARPGVSDMALLGHPGKFTYCLAEAEELSPFEPLHVSRGLQREQSAVTVAGVEAPHSVISVPTDGTPPDVLAGNLLAALAAMLAAIGSNNVYAGRGDVVVVLNPSHAELLAGAGHDRTSVQGALHERARHPRETLTSLVGPAVQRGLDTGDVAIVEAPSDILVLVAGDPGLYSVVMPSWGAGTHGNRALTREVSA
jgi:hypothetical protein